MKKETRPELVRCAEELETELRSFERVAAEIAAIPLDSQKNLERGSRGLGDLARVEERLQVALNNLLRGLDGNRQRQQASVEAVQAWAVDLQARTAEYGELARSFEALGPEIAAVSETLRLVGTVDAPTPSAIRDQIMAVSEKAGAVRRDAEERGFKDVARLAQSREEQLASAARKLSEALGGR